MAVHPNTDVELVAALDDPSLGTLDLGALTHGDLPALRARVASERAATAEPVPSTVVVEDRFVPGPVGAPEVRLRIYRPAVRTGALPGLYWIHGGGMIMGEPEMNDPDLIRIVEEVGCVAVSVDYRLAPEHPHPAPVEDCYAGLVWTAGNTAELGIAPGRLAVGGASAGGGLAAGSTLLARDRNGPVPAFQLLIYPMLDDRDTTMSSIEFADAPVWSRAANRLGWGALLGDAAGTDDVSPYAAPARAEDVSGLPPAYISVGELEIFRDECLVYAQRLLRAGVSTELHVYPGAVHGWYSMAPEAAVARAANDETIRVLRRALHP